MPVFSAVETLDAMSVSGPSSTPSSASEDQISSVVPLPWIFINSESGIVAAICCLMIASPCFQTFNSDFFHSSSAVASMAETLRLVLASRVGVDRFFHRAVNVVEVSARIYGPQKTTKNGPCR